MNNIVILYSIFIGIVMVFQASLVLGAPFGEATMGGIKKGKLPPGFRVMAFLQLLILITFELIALTRAEFIFYEFYEISKTAIWFVVGFFVIGSIMNMVTKSKIERNIWAPVNIILLTASIFIALS